MDLLHDLIRTLRRADGYVRLETDVVTGADVTVSAPGIVRPLLLSALFVARPRPVFVVAPGEEAAGRLARHLAAYLPRDVVLPIPARREMPWARERADTEAIGARARALHALERGRPALVVASPAVLLRLLPPRDSGVFDPLTLAAGQEIDFEAAVDRLSRMGYERLERAEERGTFAVRGGILDVFPSDGPWPVRAELFGDEVETLRRYVPTTGQSIGDAGALEIYPCREVRLGARAASSAARTLAKRALADPQTAHDLERIEAGIYFDGIEQYLPAFYRASASPLAYAVPETMVVFMEPRQVFDAAARAYDEIAAQAATAGVVPDELFAPPSAIDAGAHQRMTLLSLVRGAAGVDVEIGARRPDVGASEASFSASVRGLIAADYRVLVATRDRRSRERVTGALVDAGLSVATRCDLESGSPARVVETVDADVPAGYVVPEARLAVVSLDDAYSRAAVRAGGEPDRTRLTFAFGPGDYVVHEAHGIALFRDVVRREVLGVERDYLLLEYAKGDKLYVPVDQLDRVTKYVGPEGAAPRVTRLNTADWSRATARARKAAKQLAFDLVDLYARRATVDGHAFSPDTPWQLEMEEAFPFEETPDQLAAIADVKADMESTEPMDRLVCGDVGYGKTEVAIRAAFKATQDGMQVMVLCPTTILAQQHFTTFSERFEPYPLRVEVLSRFRTRAQQAEALEGFASGAVDVLIGTHRLLSSDVVPKSLGLVIVDEEQRFGVQHKEHLKHLREQVDVLTLSATPIPRTLQMALSGVRDLSVIDTPPAERYPVTVHVGEYDADVVETAIREELGRGGQVYYVSNRVRGIEAVARRVQAAAPDARVAVAHGQMKEHALERVMESFVAGQTDVLVSTTIVESGIDNPHTNTLIIEDSQRLGLAQLYQLKGRVGRSHRKAFAYFLFPGTDRLTEQAAERLLAIKEHTELGSGMRLALRDLEIRGAGSLLGAEQSGNVSAVGFDLYAQMLRDAVADARGEPVAAPPEVRVDLAVAAYLPGEYVPDVDERVLVYRRLAGITTPEGVEALAGELAARFGPLPTQARALLDIARVRAGAAELGAESVALVRRRIAIRPLALDAEARGLVAAAGGVFGDSGRTAYFPYAGDTPVAQATLAALDAILSAVRHTPAGHSSEGGSE